MSRIVRAEVLTESKDDTNHRVHIKSPGFFTDLEIESVNGIYLRKGDVVFVWVDDAFTQPLILGRCTGQLELTQLVEVINKVIDILNEDKKAFESHIHTISAATVATFVSPAGPCVLTPPTPEAQTGKPKKTGGVLPCDFPDRMDSIDENTLLK